ncbi:hypothetical protein C3L33_00431, partial [Rhododendron williamsianum]
MRVICKQSSNLLHTTKHCKTIKQLHQVHAQTITRGLLSLHPSSSLLLTTILHSLTSLLSPHSLSDIHYPLAIFNQIKNPSTFCYNTVVRAHTLLSSPLTPSSSSPGCAASVSSRRPHLPLCPQSLRAPPIAFADSSSSLSVCSVFDESSDRDVVSYNALLDGFVKAGETARAREVFDEMPVRDAVSWGTIIAGYAKLNRFEEALGLFDEMVGLDVSPDNIALVSALSACAQLGELEKGKTIHEYIERKGIRVDAYLSTGLVDLYAKCGCIETAKQIFETTTEKALFTWNAMLTGLAMHGHGQLLLDYFSRMVKARVQPDGVTFLAVLVGCSHAGLITEARLLFEEMESVYGVSRELKHYGCMADLLGELV